MVNMQKPSGHVSVHCGLWLLEPAPLGITDLSTVCSHGSALGPEESTRPCLCSCARVCTCVCLRVCSVVCVQVLRVVDVYLCNS